MAVGGLQTPNDEVLSTLLVEVERIVNNRPIVPAPVDVVGRLALTPNDLVLLHNNSGIIVPKTISNVYQLGWKQAQHLANTFWKRWIAEYLPTLQARQKWLQREREFRVGDVVMIVEDHLRRDQWPLGLVLTTSPGADGIVRTAKVKTTSGEMVRDVRRLCLLEGATDNDSSDEPFSTTVRDEGEIDDDNDYQISDDEREHDARIDE